MHIDTGILFGVSVIVIVVIGVFELGRRFERSGVKDIKERKQKRYINKVRNWQKKKLEYGVSDEESMWTIIEREE